MTFTPRPLPTTVQQLCNGLKVPPRLMAHLTLVHDAAVEIIEGLQQRFPTLSFDEQATTFGAATHDIGKVLHPAELTCPGKHHEQDGPALLLQYGVSPELARFARTHGVWNREKLPLEDQFVALADAVWKGQRIEALEAQVIASIAENANMEQWEVFDRLDGLLEMIAQHGDERLAWQQKG